MTMDSSAVLQLVEEALPMVEPIAKRLARTMGRTSQSDIDDFVGYGRAGLLEAARRFNPEFGVSFRTFASPRVEGAMLDGFRKLSALSRRTHEKLTAGSAPRPTDGGKDRDPERLLAKHLAGIATAQATGVLMQSGVDTQGEFLAVSTKTSAEEASWKQQMREVLARSIESLPSDEGTLIRRHYLDGERLDRIAQELGVSPFKVSRMHTKALESLAKLLGRKHPELARN